MIYYQKSNHTMDQPSQVNPSGRSAIVSLSSLDHSKSHTFIKPVKRIHEGHDVSRFLKSHAYVDISKLVMMLNLSMCPRKIQSNGIESTGIWQMDKFENFESESIKNIRTMLEKIGAIIAEVPPDTGPRRFGNISFRKWHEILESRAIDLLKQSISSDVLNFKSTVETAAYDELSAYLLGSFGSPQRLDYGTGHELSFLAFLGCIWKLDGFQREKLSQDISGIGRNIVLGIIEPYLQVVRQLILTYTLEPAGSHGVWGLDDHFFLPYIFGSAQYCPAIHDHERMPVEGSLPDAPSPGDVTKKSVVESERSVNMYFSAIGFIYDVKSGAFWEHSPMLFDISGVKSGWGKINKGMIKMYNVEVLSKFPVVQHFPFGSLFRWEEDPLTATLIGSDSSSNKFSVDAIAKGGSSVFTKQHARPQEGTIAPWAR